MSKQNSKLSVASGPLKTAKAVKKVSKPPQSAKLPKSLQTPVKGSAMFAPSAVSFTGSEKHTTIHGDLCSSVRMRTTGALCYITSPGSGLIRLVDNSGPGMSTTGSWSGTEIQYVVSVSLGLNPFRMINQTNSSTSATQYSMGVAFPLSLWTTQIASVYTRFRVVGKLQLWYEPYVSTSTDAAFSLNVVKDCANSTFGLASNSSRIMNAADADDTPQTISFAGWAPWGNTAQGQKPVFFDVDNDWKYTYAEPTYLTGAVTGGYNSAIARQSCAALISCLCIKPEGTEPANQGKLFYSIEYEFDDPLPVLSDHDLTRFSRLGESRLDPADDDEKKVPYTSFNLRPNGVPVAVSSLPPSESKSPIDDYEVLQTSEPPSFLLPQPSPHPSVRATPSVLTTTSLRSR